MRKIAINSYNMYHHSNSVPLTTKKQETITTEYLRLNSSPQLNTSNHINDENQISSISIKNLWSRSASKDG
jgi:hypothetical protein